MTATVYVLVILGILSFLIASLIRAIRYAREPLHLRWELYPVPHEAPERAEHGGSYFEEVDWWTKPTKFNWVSELKVMLPEILFLKGLWEFNRPLWYRSFPFHFGLYLVIAAVNLLLASALLMLFAPAWMGGGLGAALGALYTVCGGLGAGLAIAGAVGLLLRRLRDPDLRNYTAPGDLFNLAFFIVAFGLLVAGYVLRGTGESVLELTVGLLRLDTSVHISGLMAAGLILTSLLLAYVPLTHMAHFIAKYFTYHSVRWDDAPAALSGEMQKKFAEYLSYRPDWSAPHIRGDGKKTWAEIATTNPTSGGADK